MEKTESLQGLVSTLKAMTASLKEEDKGAIKKAFTDLGMIEHRARLLTLSVPTLSSEEARGLVFEAMNTASTEGDYETNVLTEATKLSSRINEPEFRDKIVQEAKKGREFDKVSSLLGSIFGTF